MEVVAAESGLTTFVDVSGYVSHKRESLRAHTSQFGTDSLFFSMPDEAFQIMFGTEWFIRKGAAPGHKRTGSADWEGSPIDRRISGWVNSPPASATVRTSFT